MATISFKQFLQEKALTPAVFAKTIERLSADAKMGFEIETWVNKESDLFVGDGPSGATYINIRQLKDFEDFRELFLITREIAGDIKDEANDWKAENGGDWAKYYEETFGEGINGANDFIKTYDLEARYGWKEENVSVYTEPPPEESGENVPWRPIAMEMAQELQDVVGTKVQVGYSGKVSDWVITEDGSIGGPGTGAGLEIISPPLPIGEAMEHLQECFHFMKRHNLITTPTTGLHINLSIPDIQRLLDPLKLVLFIGEDHVLKQFQREGNSFTKTHREDLIDSITKTGLPPKGSSLIKFAQGILKKEKYRTINLGKLRSGYLEFRAAGNTGYEGNWRKIQDTIGRFLTVLELACDPTAERQAYLKKVAKIFDAGVGQASIDTSDLTTLIRKASGLIMVNHIDDLLAQPNISRTMAASMLRVIMVDIGIMIVKKNFKPSTRVIAEFKQLLGKFKKAVNGDLIQAIYDGLDEPEIHFYELFMKAFGLWGK